jgi:hypothetical protein
VDAVPQGQIRRVWTEAGRAWMTVAVAENPINAASETNWTGSVVLDGAFQALTVAQKRAALVAAVKAVRDASQAAAQNDLGIDGPVTI